MFHRHHFKYAVQYDPSGTKEKGGTANKNFCIEFYMNKTRIYHERKTGIVSPGCPVSACPGLNFGKARGLRLRPKPTATNKDRLLGGPQVVSFHSSTQSTRCSTANQFARLQRSHARRERRRDVIAGRGKIRSPTVTSPPTVRIWSFAERYGPPCAPQSFDATRTVPTLRTEVRRGDTCRPCDSCGAGRIDDRGILQALCGPCNLKREGKRLEAEL